MSEESKKRLNELFPNYVFDPNHPINPETGHRLKDRLVQWLRLNVSIWQEETYLIFAAWPNVETIEGRLMVKMWLNQDDRKKGYKARRTMKPGKALKHFFPRMTDQQIELTVDKMRLDLGERIYILKTGREDKDFRRAYIHDQCRMENPETTWFRKSLANSCMRYENICHHDTRGNERHPVEAYASGDFHTAWIEDQSGRIAARCVIYDAKPSGPVAAPIYGVCERSMNMIQDYLDSINADCEGDWIGAELKRIPGKHGGYIAPYLDLEPRQLKDNGDSLEVSRHGEIDASAYNGLLHEENSCQCENCSARYDPECEGGIVDDMSVCQSCYEDSNFCEYYEESTFEDVAMVNLWERGRVVEQWWSYRAFSAYATEINGQYWRDDDLLTDYEGNQFTEQDLDNGEYFLSEWDSEYYPVELLCETAEGETVGKPELTPIDHWQQNQDGIWSNVQLKLELEQERDAA